MTKKGRRLLVLIAAFLLIIALAWSLWLSNNGRLSGLVRLLEAHGYTLQEDDLYLAGSAENSTIAALLTDIPFDAAILASKEAGFPSDTSRQGMVELVLLALQNEDVVTLFLVDGDVELAFVQTPQNGIVYSIGEVVP